MLRGRRLNGRARLTYANVTASVALFVALGGTSYAVATLPRNSVGEHQLKTGAVTSSKLRDRSVARADLAADALVAGPRGPRGGEGTRGAAGSTGPTGARGPQGPSNAIVRRRDGRVSIGFPVSSTVDVISLPLPFAGKWLVRTETQIGYFPDSAQADFFDCRYVIGGLTEPSGRQKGAYAGNVAGASRLPHLTHSAVVDAGGPTTVVFRCNHISNLPAESTPPFFERTVATAVTVEQVDYAEIAG